MEAQEGSKEVKASFEEAVEIAKASGHPIKDLSRFIRIGTRQRKLYLRKGIALTRVDIAGWTPKVKGILPVSQEERWCRVENQLDCKRTSDQVLNGLRNLLTEMSVLDAHENKPASTRVGPKAATPKMVVKKAAKNNRASA